MLKLTFKKTVNLEISMYLSKLLGFSYTSKITFVSKEENQSYILPFEVNDIPLHTSNIFLESNFVDFSAVGHSMGRVLKLIPVSDSSKHKNEHIEFENLEFIPVCRSELQTLSFELRSNSGSLVKFNDSKLSNIYIDLIFKQERNQMIQ